VGKFLDSGLAQVFGVFLTAVSAYGVAKLTRAGAREANQTAGWTNLVSALQKEVADLRTELVREEKENTERYKELDISSRELTRRVLRLERSRYRWKHWGQVVVPLLEGTTIRYPPPPEGLEDSDPDSMEGVK
jgi:hypothetical protein